jgi:hypothetical protein
MMNMMLRIDLMVLFSQRQQQQIKAEEIDWRRGCPVRTGRRKKSVDSAEARSSTGN